jgi:hypothetical protein
LDAEGKVGYPPIRDIACVLKSGWFCGIAPSGRASRVLEDGKLELDDPAGEEGDIASNGVSSGLTNTTWVWEIRRNGDKPKV